MVVEGTSGLLFSYHTRRSRLTRRLYLHFVPVYSSVQVVLSDLLHLQVSS